MKTYYEFKDKTSSKFWEITVKGSMVTVRYGKIGTDGQTTVKKLGSPAAAAAHADKVTAEKVKKGYIKKIDERRAPASEEKSESQSKSESQAAEKESIHSDGFRR